MLALIFSTLAIIAPLNAGNASECTSMVNAASNTVTVCAGSRVEIRDAFGTVRTYGTEIIPAARATGGKLEI